MSLFIVSICFVLLANLQIKLYPVHLRQAPRHKQAHRRQAPRRKQNPRHKQAPRRKQAPHHYKEAPFRHKKAPFRRKQAPFRCKQAPFRRKQAPFRRKQAPSLYILPMAIQEPINTNNLTFPNQQHQQPLTILLQLPTNNYKPPQGSGVSTTQLSLIKK